MSCFYLKQGDMTPALRTTLTDKETGLPLDLTAATAARIRVRKADATALLFDRVASIVAPPTSGKLEYAWQAGDTAIAGDYYVEWEVSYGLGNVKTYPSADYNLITVVPKLP